MGPLISATEFWKPSFKDRELISGFFLFLETEEG